MSLEVPIGNMAVPQWMSYEHKTCCLYGNPIYSPIYYIAVRLRIWTLLVSSRAKGNLCVYTIRDLNINIPSWLTSRGQSCQNPFRNQSSWQLRHSLKLRAGGEVKHSVSFNGVNCTNMEYTDIVSAPECPKKITSTKGLNWGSLTEVERWIDLADQDWSVDHCTSPPVWNEGHRQP